MINPKRCGHLAICRLQKELSQPRLWAVALLVAMLVTRTMIPIAQYAAGYGVGVAPVAPVFLFSAVNGSFLTVLLLLGLLALVSDSTEIDAQQTLYLIRGGRSDWLGGQVLYLLLLCVCYILFWVLLSVLPILNRLSLDEGWGRVWMSLAYYGAPQDGSINLEISNRIMMSYEPLEAMAYSVLLKIEVCWIEALLVFGGNLLTHSAAFTCVGAVFPLVDILLLNQIDFHWISYYPVTLSRLNMLDCTGTSEMPTPQMALIFMGAIVLAEIAVILIFGRKHVE